MQAGAGFAIRELRAGDVDALVPIGKDRLGIDYIGREDFDEVLSDGDQFCLVPVMDDVPIGFAICREFGPGREQAELDLPDSPQRDLVLGSGRIGLVDSVSIADGYGGHGYGTMLVEACLDRMRADGCDLSVSMAWVHPDGVEPIAKALRGAGFIRSDLVIRGYWNEWVASAEGHHCPICGAPCRCSGAFWSRCIGRSWRVSSPGCRPWPSASTRR